MGTDVQAATDFQTRMFERIRGQLGDLMTDDELKKVLTTAMDKAFFEKRRVRVGEAWRDQYAEKESVFVELVREQMKPMLEKAMGEWFRENEAKVSELLIQTFKNGVLQTAVGYFDGMLQQHVFALQQGIEDTLRRAGVIRS